MRAEACTDNRFEVIARAKEALLNGTNIESSPDEMKVIDSFLFRCWQMGWIDKYEVAKNQYLLHETKIYRNDCFLQNEINLFEKIEKALGFKLYFWQKTYLITGCFRQGGFTTAECIKQLLGNKPIDYSQRPKNLKENCERMQLIEIKEKLQRAGIETVPVFTSKKELRDYQERMRIAHSITVNEMHPKFAYKEQEGE